MIQSRTLRSLFFIAFFLCPFLSIGQNMHSMVASYLNARANGKNLKWYQRYELGYSMPLFNATYTHQYSNFDPNSNVFSDTTIRKTVATKGYGAHAGFYIPVASVGENTILAIPIHIYANSYIWSLGDINLGNGFKYNYDVLGMQAAIPFGLDVKYGCDGMMDKSQRFCFTGGVGAYPSMNITGFGSDGNLFFRVQPYLKAEIGVFAGICFKLSAMYTMGNMNFVDINSTSSSSNLDGGFGESKIKLQAKSQLTLGLTVMPFSWDWPRATWWR